MSDLRVKLFDLFRTLLPSEESAMGLSAVVEPHISNLIESEADARVAAALELAVQATTCFPCKESVIVDGDGLHHYADGETRICWKHKIRRLTPETAAQALASQIASAVEAERVPLPCGHPKACYRDIEGKDGLADVECVPCEQIARAERKGRLEEARLSSHNWFGPVGYDCNCRDCGRVKALEKAEREP